MAEESANKTEDPTTHRLEEARKQGQIAFSKEVLHWVVLFSSMVLLIFIFPFSSQFLYKNLIPFLSQVHDTNVSFAQLQNGSFTLFKATTLSFGLPLIFLFIITIVVGLIQTKFLFSLKNLKPKWEKLSPLKGMKRLFSKQAFIEFLKSVFKITIIIIALYYSLRSFMPSLITSSFLGLQEGFSFLKNLTYQILITIISILGVIALFDFFYQRYLYLKQLRMSRQDIKEELKELEGDPIIRQKRRQIRQERTRQRMMANVPKASVVVTNPTHYAVALLYDMQTMDAPKVTAKGLDFIALKIREIAKQNNVPLIENPPLARTLYESVELDAEIPPEHYKAVADVIRFVMYLKRPRF